MTGDFSDEVEGKKVIFQQVQLCSQTWRADLRGRAAPRSPDPSSTLRCQEKAAHRLPPPAQPPGSDHQRISGMRLHAVALETLKGKKKKNTLVKTLW